MFKITDPQPAFRANPLGDGGDQLPVAGFVDPVRIPGVTIFAGQALARHLIAIFAHGKVTGGVIPAFEQALFVAE